VEFLFGRVGWVGASFFGAIVGHGCVVASIGLKKIVKFFFFHNFSGVVKGPLKFLYYSLVLLKLFP
jgi:hypothetical protein